MATILLAGVDLFFRGKLESLLPGHHLVTTDSADRPDLVITDIARIDPDEVADAYPDTPILGFANHTDTAGLRAAHTAGFDQVVVKAALVERAGVSGRGDLSGGCASRQVGAVREDQLRIRRRDGGRQPADRCVRDRAQRPESAARIAGNRAADPFPRRLTAWRGMNPRPE